jgi:1-acyl-sn-glycerol-3-phosphate acyltransferase
LPTARRPSLRLPSLSTLAALRRDLPATAMGATGALALRLRELTGRDVIDLESLQEVMSVYYRLAAMREQHRNGVYDDDFGFDRELTEALMPLFRVVARRYWRMELDGTEHLPRRGGALLVSNHAGVLPWDGAMIKVAVFDAVDRHARALVATWFGELPVASWLLRRTGQAPGHPDDTLRLLRNGELVLVFPEGVKGTGKPWDQRYRLQRFGRGGFVEMAMRAGVPIVPISVLGSEETYQMVADVQPLAQLLGMPYFPITPTWPLLGPLGLLPLPSKWRITFHPPVAIVASDQPPEPSTVMEVADSIRDTIQMGVVDDLMRRQRAFRG